MDDTQARAFSFSGNWREYAPIAFTNLLLTIVTLGIYRFWAITRTRHYLWSHTRFIDAQLEWTGKAKELLIGFLMVLILFGVPFLCLRSGVEALVLQGHPGAAALLSFSAAVAILYLTGIARYRALRYRLSRTYWHGIRGGSDDSGWSYGFSYIWRTFVGALPMYLATPWAMMSLWNLRWNKLSFGSEEFVAKGKAGPIFARFLLFYLLPILLAIVAIAAAGTFGGMFGGLIVISNFPMPLRILAYLIIVLGVYALLGIIALAYYSAFLQEAIGNMKLGRLHFHFDANLDDWVTLALGDVALVVGTLGVGSVFLNYRHWKFFITHLDATGEVYVDEFTQSTTREPKQGEGLLDALDIGAF